MLSDVNCDKLIVIGVYKRDLYNCAHRDRMKSQYEWSYSNFPFLLRNGFISEKKPPASNLQRFSSARESTRSLFDLNSCLVS